MNIALVSHLFPNELATSQGKFIKDMFELLKDNSSADISLIVPTPLTVPFTKRNSLNNAPFTITSEEITRIKYLSFPKKILPRVIQKSISYTLISHLEGLSPDIVHVHWLYPDGLAIPALKKAGYKVILTIHGSDWYQSINKPHFRPIISEIFDNVDRVLYSGPKLKIDIENEFPMLSAKSDIIYNMVDARKYTVPSKAKRVEKRTKLGWDDSKLHALTVASIREEKGIDLLLDAIIDNPELKNTIFHIIGNYENTEYSKEIEKKLEQGRFQNIQVHPTVSPDELIDYYFSADYYILPSRREGFNVSILEAASCGLPVVATDVGGAKEIKDAGLIIPKGDHLVKYIELMNDNFSGYSAKEIHSYIKKSYGQNAFLRRQLVNYELTITN